MSGQTVATGCILLALGALLTAPASAEIYRWTDANGKVHFSDRPAGDRDAEKVEVRVNTYESISYDTSSIGATREVVMYSASWCGVCKKARAYFEANDIGFKEYDVEKSRKGRRDFRRLRARGVPVILIGDKRMNGFSAQGFESLYR